MEHLPSGDEPDVAAKESPLSIARVISNYANASVRLVRSDGKEAVFPLTAAPLPQTSRISKTTYAPLKNELRLETVHGEEILAELPTPNDLAPLRGRPVVYLDQKDWSQLSNALYQPEKLTLEDREAAETLISWTRQKKIVLPLSAAHMSETAKWTNDEARYRLALTIAQLSSGWQMRDPLEVRRIELRQSFARIFRNTSQLPRSAFTLEPYAVHSGQRSAGPRLNLSEFPREAAFRIHALTSVNSYFDTLLDAEPVSMDPTPQWVSRVQRFTDWLAGETSRTAAEKRASIEVFFLADTRIELAEAAYESGITIQDLSEWMVRHRHVEVARMPQLGLFLEVLVGKFLNPRTRWTNNDLTDLMYLTCAAGYADYVVGERSMVSQMEHALKRLGRASNVSRRIRDVIQVLDRTGL